MNLSRTDLDAILQVASFPSSKKFDEFMSFISGLGQRPPWLSAQENTEEEKLLEQAIQQLIAARGNIKSKGDIVLLNNFANICSQWNLLSAAEKK